MSDKTQLEQIAELLVGHCFMPPDHDLDTGDMELEMARNVAQQILDICQPQWIPVAERLPDERCIAYTDNEDITIAYRFIPARMFKQIASEATHWKPLPPPPEDTA